MMKEEVLTILKHAKFTDWEERSGDVLKFSHVYNGNILSNIYIDYSDIPPNSPSAALERQRKVLETDFYRAKGSIQWNFYYYYLLSEKNYKIHSSDQWAKEIQIDTSYARKKVVTLNTLKTSYPFSEILTRAAGSAAQFTDLSNEWVRVLKNYDLDEVFSEDKASTYDAAIERYVQGKPNKEDDAEEELTISTAAKTPQSISELILHKYRFFPSNKRYTFSTINLFEGRNGSGKTSLLEAIELVMCGKTYRHEKLSIETADISLKYQGSDEAEKFEPKGLKKFQDREQFWYGTPPTHNKNTLFKSFNRFNFFNTDASYRFSTDEEPKAIWNNFLSLALGGKTSELDKRIVGFNERFIPIERKLQKEVLEIEAEVQKLKLDLGALQSVASSIQLSRTTLDQAVSVLGLDLASDSDDQALLKIQVNLSEAKNAIGVLVDFFPAQNEINLEEIEGLKQKTEDLKQRLKIFETKLSGLNSRKQQITNRMQTILIDQEKTSRLTQYYEVDRARDIGSLQVEIQKSSDRIVQFQSSLKSLNITDLAYSEQDELLVEDAILANENEKKKLLATAQDLETKIRNTKATLDGLKTIVLEVKALGRRYLDHSAGDKCPLCEAEYDRAELEKRIEQVEFSGDDLPKLLDAKSQVDEHLKNIVLIIESVRKLVSVSKLAVEDLDINKITIKAAKKACKNLEERVNDLVQKQTSDKNVFESLLSEGFSSNEFSQLLKDTKTTITTSSPKDVLTELKQSIARLANEHQVLQSEGEKVEGDIKLALDDFSKSNVGFENLESELEITREAISRIGQSNKFLADLENVKRKFPKISITEDLRNLLSAVTGALNDVVNYLAFVNSQKQQRIAVEQNTFQIKEKEKIHALKRSHHQNAQKAIEAFKKIESEFSKEIAVKKFFNQNKPIIVDIFKAIHAPNEFEDIILKEEKIFVVKNGEERELSKISTGQRTAVALAVFFGLHLSCPLAPKVILFDDPIAFIDDLNVLAFLDFLREIAITGKRQIFFATANRKLASLIRRKFELLGSSFSTLDPLVGDGTTTLQADEVSLKH